MIKSTIKLVAFADYCKVGLDFDANNQYAPNRQAIQKYSLIIANQQRYKLNQCLKQNFAMLYKAKLKLNKFYGRWG